ncbi:hypothetical protein [Ruegeria sp.]|uniref:hypothetical protein n=1 Tax=Ruegeria sp. TaxID=1879320 RepID=UPI00230F9842|nr:hypothetical protein [Ruegeria sp.]MDA7966954.1 hypothetical protein [Ruegeria sp.]
MPTVQIYGPSPTKDKIGPLQKRSWDDDIKAVNGVNSVTSEVQDGVTYKADVDGGTTNAIEAALKPTVPSDWTLLVH